MASLTFSNPEFFFFLLLVPILALAHYILNKISKRKGMIFANYDTLKRITGRNVMTRNLIVFIFRIMAFTLIIIALAGPLYWSEGEAKESDYVLAIDVSASMTANDLQPSRLDAAKEAAKSFIDELDSGASIAVIGFSGTVFVEQSLTDDYTAAKQAIDRLDIRTVAGTDIASALVTGSNLLLATERGKVIVLFTDGSSTAGNFRDDPVVHGTRYAKENEVTVHTVGIGERGSVPTGYLPRLYNVTAEYNEEVLQYIADETAGLALSGASNQQLTQSYQELLVSGESRITVRELALLFLIASLLVLFAEWGLTNTRYRILP